VSVASIPLNDIISIPPNITSDRDHHIFIDQDFPLLLVVSLPTPCPSPLDW